MTFKRDWAPAGRNQVIGESYADGAFIKAVAAAHGVPAFDYTAPEGKDGVPLGKDGFKKHLVGMQTFIDRDEVARVVVLGDNDSNHAGALTAIRRAIRDAECYPTPSVNPLEVAQSGNLRIGIIMLPGTGTNGCLETLLLQATATHGPAAACLEAWLQCSGFPQIPRNNYDKFRFRSLLAACIHSEPNISIQRMWQSEHNPIQPNDQAFAWVATFLQSIFG